MAHTPLFLYLPESKLTVREVLNVVSVPRKRRMKEDLVSVSIMLASLVLEVHTGSRGQGCGIESHPHSQMVSGAKAGWLRERRQKAGGQSSQLTSG